MGTCLLIAFNGYSQHSYALDHSKTPAELRVDSIVVSNEINLIQTLVAENQLLKDRLNQLEIQMATLAHSSSPQITWDDQEVKVALFQNTPNPFFEETTIYYKVDKDLKGPVAIWLYTMKGKEIEKYENLSKGLYALRLSSRKLKAGSYIYHLVVQGQIMDSKILMLEKVP